MTTLYWILAVYGLTVAISYPFIRREILNHYDNSIHMINPYFTAAVISLIPIYNLHLTAKVAFQFIIIRKLRKKLKRVFKDHPDPEVRRTIDEVFKGLGDISNPNNKE